MAEPSNMAKEADTCPRMQVPGTTCIFRFTCREPSGNMAAKPGTGATVLIFCRLRMMRGRSGVQMTHPASGGLPADKGTPHSQRCQRCQEDNATQNICVGEDMLEELSTFPGNTPQRHRLDLDRGIDAEGVILKADIRAERRNVLCQ
jgi:hypothetical protein